MPEIVEMPITVLALAGTPTAKYEGSLFMSFCGKVRKNLQNGKKFVKKTKKRDKIQFF
jgi:hypothetical protein